MWIETKRGALNDLESILKVGKQYFMPLTFHFQHFTFLRIDIFLPFLLYSIFNQTCRVLSIQSRPGPILLLRLILPSADSRRVVVSYKQKDVHTLS